MGTETMSIFMIVIILSLVVSVALLMADILLTGCNKYGRKQNIKTTVGTVIDTIFINGLSYVIVNYNVGNYKYTTVKPVINSSSYCSIGSSVQVRYDELYPNYCYDIVTLLDVRVVVLVLNIIALLIALYYWLYVMH